MAEWFDMVKYLNKKKHKREQKNYRKGKIERMSKVTSKICLIFYFIFNKVGALNILFAFWVNHFFSLNK